MRLWNRGIEYGYIETLNQVLKDYGPKVNPLRIATHGPEIPDCTWIMFIGDITPILKDIDNYYIIEYVPGGFDLSKTVTIDCLGILFRNVKSIELMDSIKDSLINKE